MALFAWLRGRKQRDEELAEEIRSHLAMAIRERIERGEDPAEAETNARREFGNAALVKEVTRDMWGWGWLETLLQDLRYGLRQLRRNPGFTAVAVITLALGIGANTAIFSLVDAVMLKMLPVHQPDQLMVLNWVSNGHPTMIRGYDGSDYEDKMGRDVGTSFSYPLFEAIRRRNHVFSAVTGFVSDDQPLNVQAGGQSGLAKGYYVSGSFFSTLGVHAARGRVIVPTDDRKGAVPVVVISYAYWTTRFGRDPSVVGKTITVNGVPFTLVGVAAPKFDGLQSGEPTDCWIPLQTFPRVDPSWGRWLPKGQTMFTSHTEWWVLILARLKPGMPARRAQAALDLIVQQEAAGMKLPPAGKRRPGTSLQPPTIELEPGGGGLDTLRRQFTQPLFVLMCLVGLVLLLACTNVASLLLARAESRQKEVAVRLALGAGRRRLIRQLLTESTLLALAGGACGVILAYWASGVLLAFMASGRDALHLTVSPDLRVLGFTLIVSLLTGILFGLAPALRSTRLDLTPALKEGMGGVDGGTNRPGALLSLGFGKGLVVSQGALAVLLLVGAGLFVRTLVNLVSENLGFDRSNILLFGIDASRVGYKGERLVNLYQEVQHRIEAIPGVRSATLSRHYLIDDGYGGEDVSIQGYVPRPGEARHGRVSVDVHYVGSNFFETFRIPLLLGRTIGDGDNSSAPRIGVANQAFVRRYYGSGNPIGRRFGFGDAATSSDMAIVGVVGDTRYSSLRKTPPPTLYVPFAQHADMLDWMNFEVRTSGDPKNWVDSVRRAVHGVDRNLPLSDVMTQIQQVGRATFQERLFARVSSFFALLALVLAGVGLYGITSYAVARRTNEIGIRMALGAERSKILRMILRESLILAALGIAIGVPVALAASRGIAAMLYGLKATDPVVVLSASAVLAVAAFLAAFLPARRATKVDPMVALRHE